VTFAYDVTALGFDFHRALPSRVPEAIRTAILASISTSSPPRLLDLGAGTGRIGRSFVAADDDYVGIDLSLAMLREFNWRTHGRLDSSPCLVQADGEHLPFRDATFDAVMLVQIFGGLRGWRRVLAEARRVLRPAGTLVVGHTIHPVDGVDAQMKQRLALLLGEVGIQPERVNARNDALRLLESEAQANARLVAATWNAERTPRGFIDRHWTGAVFSILPETVKEEARYKLGAWAAANFGSLDAAFLEQHRFELQVFKFQ
jgi:ubiquinone/menaquinone biosynthesis C-methylase UbiE